MHGTNWAFNLELSTDVCQEIEAHVAGCSPCIDFAESLRQTVELCRRFRPIELSEPLAMEAYQN